MKVLKEKTGGYRLESHKSKVSIGSDDFLKNKEYQLDLLQKMHQIETRAVEKSAQRKETFEKRNQLSPRDRLGALLDPGMPFLHMYNLAGYLVDDSNPDTAVAGANVIAGIGYVSGVQCVIYIDDSGINAGAITLKSVEKGLACINMSKKFKLPLVHLVESAGVNLLEYSVELWTYAGGLFGGLAELSALGIPVVTVLHGPSTAGGAYQPGLSDYVIGVKKNGMAALAGSALVKAATGEISQDQELGGAEMHSKVTGLVEYLADHDQHAIKLARKVVRNLGWEKIKSYELEFGEPRYSSEEILGIVPTSFEKSYDVRELMLRIVDGSEFLEFKSGYGVSTVCVHAKVFGKDCSIIGNNGPIDPNGATKAAQFIQLSDQVKKPIIFLNNTTGYLVGKEYEQQGMIKHGSKMIQAVMNARVSKITFYIGASFGAGNYGMCGYAFKPDFLFTWPNAKTGVMGGKQAAMTMNQVWTRASERKGKKLDQKNLKTKLQEIEEHFESQSDAFYTSGRMMDQGMIDPRDTRKVIGFCLGVCENRDKRQLNPNSFGIARL